MKRILGVFILSLFFFHTWAQGWRNGEMEVRVMIDEVSDVQQIRGLGFDFEPASADGSSVRMYLTPDELKQLKNKDLRCEITIPDMNSHFAHFWDNPLVPAGYYTYEQIIAIADSLTTNFPLICKKVSWGTSIGGRQLAALKISDNVDTDEAEAEIMFDGGIHGDEVGGSQNIIMFARDLCLGYDSDPTITDAINNREIWLYLMVNPDGRVSMSRYNNNGVDCNRDNGYMWDGEGNSWGAFSQIETKALRNGILDNQFVVYTNYHSGTEILSYPWSYRTQAPRDLLHINHLASEYSNASGYSNLQFGQGYNIMYAINGSTKDFQYGSLGNIGWSMEISLDKQPPSSQISYYYNANKPAMLAIINQCGWGVSGMVTDSITGEPVRASVWVNNYYPVYTDPVVGDYHKYLTTGSYNLKVMANGYQTKTITNFVVPGQGAVEVNVQLVPASTRFAFKVMSCRIPGNNFGDEGYTPGALGKPDTIPYSLGKNGWVILDMGDTIYNGAGDDFKVYQSGIPAKAFTVSGSNNIDGPFTTIGVGNGTSSFDLNTVSLTKVRYLQVKDNGGGSAYGVGAGFNLDAVEMLTLPLVVNFTVNTTTPCSGTSVNFTDLSGGNPTSWSWSFPGGTPSASSQQNPENIHYDTPGVYTVSLTASNGMTSGTETKSGFITVKSSPVVHLGNDTALCAWNTLLLDAGNPGALYQWSTGATTQTITADSSGTGYGSAYMWVDVTNSENCTTRDSIKITFETCSGMAEVEDGQSVTIFPNPSDGHFTLKISGFGGGFWQLYSMDGGIVTQAEIPVKHFHHKVNVEKIGGGSYVLKVQSKDGILVRKIIIGPVAGR